MSKKHTHKGKIITLIIGLILLVISVSIYLFNIQGFFREVMSELFAFGFAITLIAIGWILFKIKIKIGG